ncbi:MAG TPA: carbon storage regulator CsrA, partial [Leptospiraceae bacterium]|nr:carbon storage regulator CsrA [Leptospiraceae bacterium]
MLVLARRLNQSILIGEEVEIVVVEIKGDQVKLGIKAPKNVSVHRAEVLKEIQEENKKAKADILPTNLSEL